MARQAAVNADRSEQSAILETLTRDRTSAGRGEPRTAEQVQRKSTIQQRLGKLLLAAGGAPPVLRCSVRLSRKRGSGQEIKQVVQVLVGEPDKGCP